METPTVSDSEFTDEGPIEWEEVVSSWEQREAGIWESFIKENGYEGWQDFRLGPRGTLSKYGFGPLLDDVTWSVKRVLDVSTVPKIHTGPFRGWAIHNPNREPGGQGVRACIPFRDVVAFGEISKNSRVQGIYHQIMGSSEARTAVVLFDHRGRAVAPDGSHTLSAYALAATKSQTPKAPLLLHSGLIKNDIGGYLDRFMAGQIPIVE